MLRPGVPRTDLQETSNGRERLTADVSIDVSDDSVDVLDELSAMLMS